MITAKLGQYVGGGFMATEGEVSGKSLKAIQDAMRSHLDVGGPRGLLAQTDTGATIQVSLYDGEDYIKLANGRMIK